MDSNVAARRRLEPAGAGRPLHRSPLPDGAARETRRPRHADDLDGGRAAVPRHVRRRRSRPLLLSIRASREPGETLSTLYELATLPSR